MRASIALTLLLAALQCAAADATRFAAIAFHDVVDTEREIEGDAILTDRLVGVFEWIRANGARPITLDDIAAARAGRRPLPDRAVLIMFDDGYRSLYTRVYPLVLAYRIPVVAALVGEWMEAPMGSEVDYAGKRVSRRKFVSWDEAREMQASGLVEFGSHSHALHRERALETTDVAADLVRSRELLRRELGRAPRALVWPYGRYPSDAATVARAAGFDFAFTLDPALADTASPLALARYYPRSNPTVGEVVGWFRSKRP